MHTINSNTEHFKELILFPDYTASGIWCSCGLGCSDPEDTLNLPHWLIEIIDMWSFHWDLCSTNHVGLNVENVEKQILDVGKHLAEKVSEFIPCQIDEDRCKLNCIENGE